MLLNGLFVSKLRFPIVRTTPNLIDFFPQNSWTLFFSTIFSTIIFGFAPVILCIFLIIMISSTQWYKFHLILSTVKIKGHIDLQGVKLCTHLSGFQIQEIKKKFAFSWGIFYV